MQLSHAHGPSLALFQFLERFREPARVFGRPKKLRSLHQSLQLVGGYQSHIAGAAAPDNDDLSIIRD